MADHVEFQDFSMEVKAAIGDAGIAFLKEAAGELVSQIARTTPVDTGQLKNSWQYKVDESKMEATIGSPLENAIWNEFGTGEYAKETGHQGRLGGWVYKDAKGFHFTLGKRPNRTFGTAFKNLQPKIIKAAKERFGDL